jgi:hypothetical protein
MTWKENLKAHDILRMIDNLESRAFSYSKFPVDEEEEKTLKKIFATLREMYKDYPEDPPKRPVFGGQGRIKDVQFSDE